MQRKNLHKKFLRTFVSKNKFFSFSFIIFIISLAFIVTTLIRVFIQNKTFITYVKNGSIVGGNKNINITMEIPFKNETEKNCWQEADGRWGSQYDITIYNQSRYSFVDWILVMTVPDETLIDSSWNADYVLSKGRITITGIEKAFTTIIPEKNSIKMGYVLYSNNLIESSNFYLTGRFIRNPFKEIFFQLGLSCFILSLVVILVSIFFYQKMGRQAKIDNEKIESLLKLCASFIDTRDEYTKMHSTHVGLYSKQIAAEMGFNEDFQKNIYYMGMMHDVGKVLISKEILCKPGNLTEEEWAEMKTHTIYGNEILESFNAVNGIRDAALHHHERYDGSGYPSGLKGEEIPIQARIIAVADSYDAMHTNRSYRRHLSDDVIISEIEKNRGIQFDPDVADAILRLLKSGRLGTDC